MNTATTAQLVGALVRLTLCGVGGYYFGLWMGSFDAGMFAFCVLMIFCP
jgi:hypothetical protein